MIENVAYIVVFGIWWPTLITVAIRELIIRKSYIEIELIRKDKQKERVGLKKMIYAWNLVGVLFLFIAALLSEKLDGTHITWMVCIISIVSLFASALYEGIRSGCK